MMLEFQNMFFREKEDDKIIWFIVMNKSIRV